jgi:Histidine kinase-, DNA gyrase B-, and HSP90-like ATPase
MDGIVVPEHFIQATRESGYRDLASALAEIIDNGIDAGASEVDVRIEEDRREGQREITISVLDNGRGMDKLTLWESLRFGGSERFGERDRFGRFGMGLPNSSVSQAARVDVLTWRLGRPPLRAHLDVDEIATRALRDVPEPRPGSMPDWVIEPPPSGTIVRWSRCDRLRYKKASTIVRKLTPTLGRMYRVAMSEGLIIRVNNVPVSRTDPLFRSTLDGMPGGCEPYGDPLEYRITTSRGMSFVTVQFVELPVSRWHDLPIETKRAGGIVGGAGLSVLRAGREIDYGWHLFGRKRRENYDDWWRAELSFDPNLDELIGVTHNKQGINPSPELRMILEPDLERIARVLNTRVRQAFSRVRPTQLSSAANRATIRDRFLPPVSNVDYARRSSVGGFQFVIGEHSEAIPDFFRMEADGDIVRLDFNRHHPFYRELSRSRCTGTDGLEVVLLAAARALLEMPEEARKVLLRTWSDNLLAYLER